MKVLEARGWDVRGLGFSRAHGRIVRCDLFNGTDLKKQFDEYRPTIVVHCAAERRPDVLQNDEEFAIKINVDVTRTVAELCRDSKAWLISISTNYVFDGKEAPYAEDALPNPVSTYGRSKHLAEKAVSEVWPSTAIVRIPLLVGPVEKLSETSVTTLLEGMLKQADDPSAKPKFDNWQERFPTSTEDLARVLEAFMGAYANQAGSPSREEAFGGVYHWQSNERHTKYSMACILADIAGIEKSGFVKVDDAPPPGSAPRPQFERMLCTRLERILISNGEGSPDTYRSDFRQGMERYLQPFLNDAPIRKTTFLSRLGKKSSVKGACLCLLAVASASLYAAYSVRGQAATDGRAEATMSNSAWRAKL